MLANKAADIPDFGRDGVRPFVVIVVKCGDEYLLLERAPGKRWANQLNLPGGKVEDEDEDLAWKAAARELEEETGIRVGQGDLRRGGHAFRRLPDPRDETKFVDRSIDILIVEFPSGQKPDVVARGGHVRAEWKTLSEIQALESAGQVQVTTTELIQRAEVFREPEEPGIYPTLA